MTSVYEPELGQMMFGRASFQTTCPEILDAALMSVSHEMRRVLWNLRQHEVDPFGNSYDAFRCDAFGVWSYDWSDEDEAEQPYNFACPKHEIALRWYKYFGRGMSVSRDVSPGEVSDMLIYLLTYLRDVETGAEQFQTGDVCDVPYFA